MTKKQNTYSFFNYRNWEHFDAEDIALPPSVFRAIGIISRIDCRLVPLRYACIAVDLSATKHLPTAVVAGRFGLSVEQVNAWRGVGEI